MRAIALVCLFVAGSTAACVYAHYATHGVINAVHSGLAFFLVINVLICGWEVLLGRHIDYIHADNKRLSDKWGTRRLAAVGDLFMTDVATWVAPGDKTAQGSNLNPKFWARIWSSSRRWAPACW